MSRLRFENQSAKRKTWVFPLLIIVLLYVTIPIILINRGNKSIEKNFTLLESDMVNVPTEDYFAGISFLETATIFPGFSSWVEKSIKSSNEKMLDVYKSKCESVKSIDSENNKLNSDSLNYQEVFCGEWKKFYVEAKIKDSYSCEICNIK